jgi:quercetin dioxygenase-like cupin family protein
MIHQGDVIENEVTGELLVFRQTSQETNGELVVVEAFVKPTGFVASAHLHPYQEERFEVLSGEVGFKLDRSRLIAGPGQRVTVPAGTPHKFWNAGDDEAHFVCEVRPALQFERLIETMFSLAADGKTNRKGMFSLRRREAPLPARVDAADGTRPGRTARSAPGLRGGVRAPGGRGRITRKRKERHAPLAPGMTRGLGRGTVSRGLCTPTAWCKRAVGATKQGFTSLPEPCRMGVAQGGA